MNSTIPNLSHEREAFEMITQMIYKDDWQERAACKDVDDPDIFFPPRGSPATQAKAICHICDVRVECLNYAIKNREEYGIFGGFNRNERRAIQKDD